MKKQSTKHVRFVLFFVALLFGINPTIVKLGIQNMSAMSFTTLRLFVASFAFLIVLYFSKTYRKVEKADIPKFLMMGLGALIFQLGLIFGLKYVSAATAATVIAIMPISVIIINYFIKRGVIQKNKYIGAFITMIGIFMISGKGVELLDYSLNQRLMGLGMLFLAQLAAASYTVISEDLVKRYSHYQVSTLMFGLVFLGFTCISFKELINLNFTFVPLIAWGCILYGGIFSLCIANTLWIWGVKKIGSNETSIYNNLPPVFALLSGIIFLNEIPVLIQVLGIFVVVIGMYIFSQNYDRIVRI